LKLCLYATRALGMFTLLLYSNLTFSPCFVYILEKKPLIFLSHYTRKRLEILLFKYSQLVEIYVDQQEAVARPRWGILSTKSVLSRFVLSVRDLLNSVHIKLEKEVFHSILPFILLITEYNKEIQSRMVTQCYIYN